MLLPKEGPLRLDTGMQSLSLIFLLIIRRGEAVLPTCIGTSMVMVDTEPAATETGIEEGKKGE